MIWYFKVRGATYGQMLSKRLYKGDKYSWARHSKYHSPQKEMGMTVCSNEKPWDTLLAEQQQYNCRLPTLSDPLNWYSPVLWVILHSFDGWDLWAQLSRGVWLLPINKTFSLSFGESQSATWMWKRDLPNTGSQTKSVHYVCTAIQYATAVDRERDANKAKGNHLLWGNSLLVSQPCQKMILLCHDIREHEQRLL